MKQRMKMVVLLAVGLAACVAMVGCTTTAAAVDPFVRTVEVSGTGTVKVAPDKVSFTVAISEIAETTLEAQQTVNKKLSQILTILRNNGISEADLKTNYVTLYPEYRWDNGKQELVGQRASQQVSVTLLGIKEQPNRLATIVDQLGSVTGIEFSSVSYGLVDTSSYYNEARALAIEKAMEKASVYATSALMTLGEPLSISEQGEPTYYARSYPMANMKMAAAADMATESSYSTQLPTGDVEISATVYITFEML